jgi:hypothetical protein
VGREEAGGQFDSLHFLKSAANNGLAVAALPDGLIYWSYLTKNM